MKKLILSVFIFTFGFATATHAQKGKLRCRFAEARFSGLVPGRYFTNHLKTFIP
jgi:hypothetical protein